MMVEDTRFWSWQITQASTVLRAPPWNASASVFEPEVVPSAPWQTLHLSLDTTCRRGINAPDNATSAFVCCTTTLTSTVGDTGGRGSSELLTSSFGSLTWPMPTTRAVPCATAVAESAGSGRSIVYGWHRRSCPCTCRRWRYCRRCCRRSTRSCRSAGPPGSGTPGRSAGCRTSWCSRTRASDRRRCSPTSPGCTWHCPRSGRRRSTDRHLARGGVKRRALDRHLVLGGVLLVLIEVHAFGRHRGGGPMAVRAILVRDVRGLPVGPTMVSAKSV